MIKVKWYTKYNYKVVDTGAQVQGARSVRHNITKHTQTL